MRVRCPTSTTSFRAAPGDNGLVMSSKEEPTQASPPLPRDGGVVGAVAGGQYPPETSVVPGSVLVDRYELKVAVGRGGMAEVWRAEDLLLQRTVAVKLFLSGTGHDARQRSEAVTLARLAHPGLVTVFDAVLSDGVGGQRSFLVTEFVDGPNLRQHLDQSAGGRMTSAEVADLGSQLAEALAYVHAAGIVHRDLKPANVLLDRLAAGAPRRPKLADFGIALLAGSARLTEHGTTIGTANYLSPEQVSGSGIGAASDVYSLGLILLECLTGELAYPGNGIEAAVARLHRPPRLPAGLTTQWRELLTKMFAYSPDERPLAATVAAALTAVPTGTAVTSPEGATLETVAPRKPGQDLPTRQDDGQSRDHGTRAVTRPQTRFGTAGVAGRFLTRWLVGAVAAIVVITVVVALIVTLSPGTGTGGKDSPTPVYPRVTGKLGRDLTTLQRDVRP
jgi:serine/threonine protein kinase